MIGEENVEWGLTCPAVPVEVQTFIDVLERLEHDLLELSGTWA